MALGTDPTGAYLKHIAVVVRSSPTLPKSLDMTGQLAHFNNVQNIETLLAACKACWASMYTKRTIHTRKKHLAKKDSIGLSLIIQRSLTPSGAGIVHPQVNNTKILVESIFGLPHPLISGAIKADEFTINPSTKKITKNISNQSWCLLYDDTNKKVKTPLPKELQDKASLTDEQLQKIINYTQSISDYAKDHHQFNFLIANNSLYITKLQKILFPPSLPEKQNQPKKTKQKIIERKDATILVSGTPIVPGIAKGQTKIINDLTDLKTIIKGDIVVLRTLSHDYYPKLQKASAIIIDTKLSPKQITKLKELNIPSISQTEIGTQKLFQKTITINAQRGEVYKNTVALPEKPRELSPIQTKTKVYAILNHPQLIDQLLATNPDGIGLLEAESLLNKETNLIKLGGKTKVIEQLTKQIKPVCKALKNKPVWYKVHNNIPNDLLDAEFQVIQKLHLSGYKNLGVLVPSISDINNLRKIKSKFEKQTGLIPCKDIGFGLSLDTPGAVQIFQEICKEEISTLNINLDQLAKLTLGHSTHSYTTPAILKQIKYIAKLTQKYHIPTSVHSKQGLNEKILQELINAEFTSVCIDYHFVKGTKTSIANIEKS